MLQRQPPKTLQFDKGLNTQGDRRAQSEDLLDVAVNCEYDDLGGLRVRFPFGPINSNITGGGTLTNCRRLAIRNNELCCFTSAAFYAWSEIESSWTKRGDHDAVAIDEVTVASQTTDQLYCDRCELNGVVYYCWISNRTLHTGSPHEPLEYVGTLMISAVDKENGSVLYPPTAVPLPSDPTNVYSFQSGTTIRPRMVPMASTVMMLYEAHSTVYSAFVLFATTAVWTGSAMSFSATTNGLYAIAIGANTGTPNYYDQPIYYDVSPVILNDSVYVAALTVPTSGSPSNYLVAQVTSSLTLTHSATHSTIGPGNGSIAIATSPTGANFMVVYPNAALSQMYADLWSATGSTFTATTIGSLGALASTSLMHVTAVFLGAQVSGQYRCWVTWATDEAPYGEFESRTNWCDTGAGIGTSYPLVNTCGIASHAFTYNQHAYVWTVYAQYEYALGVAIGEVVASQTTYYLYREDGLLTAKATTNNAGSFQPAGWLPGVQADPSNADVFRFLGMIAELDPVVPNTGSLPSASMYSDRTPREITTTFDDNRARRTVQIGNTLYVSGGIVLQYDGVRLTEVGFCVYAPILENVSVSTTGGHMLAGTYSYYETYSSMNAANELERSAWVTISQATTSGSAGTATWTYPNLYVTRKPIVAVEVWRTAVNPANNSVPFYLATAVDSTLTGQNGYILSVPSSDIDGQWTDGFADLTLTTKAENTQIGSVLEDLPPPAASIIYADTQRIYLAGIPGLPNTVYYSKQHQDGKVASFNDTLSFEVPFDGGPIQALGYLDGTLIVWCQTTTYAYTGPGFADDGSGSNWTLARIISSDLGAESAESVAFYEDGWMVSTVRGWYVLNRSLSYQYIGYGVAAYNGETILSMQVMATRYQVRIVTNMRMLVFDFLADAWTTFSIGDGLDAITGTDNSYTYLTPTGSRYELSTWTGYAGTDYTLTAFDIETSWIKFNELQGRAIIDFVQLLGEYRSSCVVRVRIAKDYEATAPGVWNYNTDITWTPTPTTNGTGLQLRQGPRWKRVESLKVRYTITNPDGVSPLGGPAARLTSIIMPFAVEPGPYSAIGAAQKQ